MERNGQNASLTDRVSGEYVVNPIQTVIEEDACHHTGDGIDGVVRLQIEGGEKHEYTEGQQRPEKQSVLCRPGQKQDDGGHTHVTAREGRCRTLAGLMGRLQ